MRRALISSALAIAILAGLICYAQPPRDEQVVDVSLIRLIASPEQFQGKRVRVIGYCRMEHEGNAIYIHSDFAKYGVTRNALWLEPSAEMKTNEGKIDQCYILVEATFDIRNQGHQRLFSGTLSEITRFRVWSSPVHI